jgi:hypothetical protein
MASGSQKIYGDLVGDNYSSISNFAIPYYLTVNDSNSYLTRDGLMAIGSGSLYFKRSGSNPIKVLDDVEYNILQDSVNSISSISLSGSFVYLSYINNSGSTINISGSIIESVPKTVISNYSLNQFDGTIRVNASGSSINISLMDANLVQGRTFIIKKVDNTLNSVNIIPSGSQLIDDYNYLSTSIPKSSYTIQSFGTGWDIL